MKIGIPKEIKNNEYRVSLSPISVLELTANNHTVIVESNAGIGVGFSDKDYEKAGGTIATVTQVFKESDLIVKVKEPLDAEIAKLTAQQTLFSYLHLAADKSHSIDLINSGATCIAYETITSPYGDLPLLTPMSAIAGRLAVQKGAMCLEKPQQGAGVLLSGVTGVEPAKVVILGGGVVGYNAAKIAVGMGADVAIIDLSNRALKRLEEIFGSKLKTIYSNKANIAEQVAKSDLLIGGVLIPGATAPKLVNKQMIKTMKKGSVVVDVAIDQGGCFETSHPTTHDKPTYIVDGVVHYCVTNMPSVVARTSTLALNNAILPFVLKLANLGINKALKTDEHFANGLNIYQGKITHKELANSLDLKFHNPHNLL